MPDITIRLSKGSTFVEQVVSGEPTASPALFLYFTERPCDCNYCEEHLLDHPPTKWWAVTSTNGYGTGDSFLRKEDAAAMAEGLAALDVDWAIDREAMDALWLARPDLLEAARRVRRTVRMTAVGPSW